MRQCAFDGGISHLKCRDACAGEESARSPRPADLFRAGQHTELEAESPPDNLTSSVRDFEMVLRGRPDNQLYRHRDFLHMRMACARAKFYLLDQ